MTNGTESAIIVRLSKSDSKKQIARKSESKKFEKSFKKYLTNENESAILTKLSARVDSGTVLKN